MDFAGARGKQVQLGNLAFHIKFPYMWVKSFDVVKISLFTLNNIM